MKEPVEDCAKCMTVLALWEDKLGSKPWPQVTRLAGRYGDIMHKFYRGYVITFHTA
ncbi:hypothetical protein SCLCIDRAFT_1211146 [Scleroderma citrinum Foug A]|uniref:Uncharacterized protein n=1 Tax=Scleroderma citrinum Foug A TaxID=1036808 RepID=A0A0C3E0R9_9AGAM|nr:hypothetical protein SCLCIDRAFT_1211146 [Scleroderma citrinum Foug A]